MPSVVARARPSPAIAVVVPVRNEAAEARALAACLAPAAERHEVVIVDGDSDDGSAELLTDLLPGVPVARAPRGRARQMNAGARATRAPILLFLHADTRLPDRALDEVARAVDGGAGFGCFPLRIDSGDARLRLAEKLINLRSQLLCSATGDQAIFVRRDLFDAVGGFPEVALCEDLALMRSLCGRAPFRLLDAPVTTSARRWEQNGINRTIALMWTIRAAFHLGLDPRLLSRLYAEVRREKT
jgi:rSAM/selenodomain-associated transferase 2